MLKVFIQNGSDYHADWLGAKQVFRMTEADLLVLTGGADVDPTLYGHKRHPTTGTSASRDSSDIKAYRLAVALNVPVLGICRGSQLLCVLNHGTLIQNCDNHLGEHEITTIDNYKLRITSTHHQMAVPNPEYSQIIAWADKLASVRSYMGNLSDLDTLEDKDPEVILYYQKGVKSRKVTSIGIQGHPEFPGVSETTRLWLKIQLAKYFNLEVDGIKPGNTRWYLDNKKQIGFKFPQNKEVKQLPAKKTSEKKKPDWVK